jgi:ribosomal protein S18 acetylase RimI-like enzyme
MGPHRWAADTLLHMQRTLLRMERSNAMPPPPLVDGIVVRRWRPERDHARIPGILAAGFGRDPWPADWNHFDHFDPDGVFVADAADGTGVGFAICFRRGDAGYISVVAVIPEYRRRGIASALVATAVRYLASLGLEPVRIDAYEDAPAAVAAYRSLGFEVYETTLDAEADPRGEAEE